MKYLEKINFTFMNTQKRMKQLWPYEALTSILAVTVKEFISKRTKILSQCKSCLTQFVVISKNRNIILPCWQINIISRIIYCNSSSFLIIVNNCFLSILNSLTLVDKRIATLCQNNIVWSCNTHIHVFSFADIPADLSIVSLLMRIISTFLRARSDFNLFTSRPNAIASCKQHYSQNRNAASLIFVDRLSFQFTNSSEYF